MTQQNRLLQGLFSSRLVVSGPAASRTGNPQSCSLSPRSWYFFSRLLMIALAVVVFPGTTLGVAVAARSAAKAEPVPADLAPTNREPADPVPSVPPYHPEEPPVPAPAFMTEPQLQWMLMQKIRVKTIGEHLHARDWQKIRPILREYYRHMPMYGSPSDERTAAAAVEAHRREIETKAVVEAVALTNSRRRVANDGVFRRASSGSARSIPSAGKPSKSIASVSPSAKTPAPKPDKSRGAPSVSTIEKSNNGKASLIRIYGAPK